MFAGDDTAAVVLDFGSSYCKAGFAGDDCPKAVFESSVAQQVGDGGVRRNFCGTNSICVRRDNTEIREAVVDGQVADWDLMEALYDFTFNEQLRIASKEHPVLHTECSYNPRAHREKTVELFFDKYEVPAFFLAKDAVLAVFASQRQSGLVVDVGGGKTSVTPVYDGYALQQGIVHSTLGGDLLTRELRKALAHIEVRPRFEVKREEVSAGQFEVQLHEYENTTPSYRSAMIDNVFRDMKESICTVAEDPWQEQQAQSLPTAAYELPDGQQIQVGATRMRVPELLFTPAPLEQPGLMGVHQMIGASVDRTDVDVRRELYSSVILTGGSALLPSFSKRLENELLQVVPSQMYKLRMVATSFVQERRFGSWIGGSILASLGTFHQLWISRQEYDEYGASVVHKKCP